MGATHQPRSQTSKLIAIIDDDQSMRDTLLDLIESTGLVARCFGSAEEFLEYDLHRQVGCLIAEIQMPGMSGLELQARLKKEQCNIPIILITSNGGARIHSSDERGRSRVPGDSVIINYCSKQSEQHLICDERLNNGANDGRFPVPVYATVTYSEGDRPDRRFER